MQILVGPLESATADVVRVTLLTRSAPSGPSEQRMEPAA